MFHERPTKSDFQFLLDSFKARLVGWKTNFLSLARRTTLIKSTHSTLPNHIMQYTVISKSIMKKMEQYMYNSLWGTTSLKKRIHLVNWKNITTPTSLGGLGIQRLELKPILTPLSFTRPTVGTYIFTKIYVCYHKGGPLQHMEKCHDRMEALPARATVENW